MTADERVNLFMSHQELIYKTVDKYYKKDDMMDKILDAGTNGLLKATFEFNEQDNIDFKAFAIFHIKTAINEYLESI
jgi:DNA-directed RNA polymerase specialized sigma subunit